MASNALEHKAFGRTIELLQDDPANTSFLDGATLVQKWLKVVEGTQIAAMVETRLRELNGVLQLANPDVERIRGILLDLADHTAQIGQSRNLAEFMATEVEELATALRQFATQL